MNRRQFFKRIGQVGAVAAVPAVAAQPGKYGYAASVPLSSLNGGSIWEDAQAVYLNDRKFTEEEICRIFGVKYRKPLETQKPPV